MNYTTRNGLPHGYITALLKPSVAEGRRDYARRKREGIPQDEWTRSCAAEYERLRLNITPGAREKSRAYYHANHPNAKVNLKKRKYP